MSDVYSLSPRRARVARISAAMFLFAAALSLFATAIAAARPGEWLHCTPQGCGMRTDLINLAPEDQRQALAASAPARAAFERHVSRTPVRAGLAAVMLAKELPFTILMVTVGLALRQLGGRRGNDLARALPHLRRAAIAALLMTIAAPVGASLQAMLLYPGTPEGAIWYAEFDFAKMAYNAMLALAAFAVVWALDAGSRAEDDMAAII